MPFKSQEPFAPARRPGWIPRLVLLALLLVTLAALTAAVSGFGHRWGWWDFRTGFLVLRWSVYAAIAGGVLSVLLLPVTVLRRRLRETAAAGVVALVAIAVVSIPLQWLQLARNVPPIHDITTDTADPPAFEAVLPLRADATNATDYAGDELAAQQRTAYPDIAPLELEVSVEEAFAMAHAAARAMGWEIIAADAARGRIEAVATTFWFGFRDDVVVRISAHDAGARIDVRSVSRVGRSDAGANALRIRTYLDRIVAAG